MTGHSPSDNYQELCRLCASYDSNKLDIFSDSGKERNLIGKIASCLSFEVSKDDLYPKSLCFRCIYNLENFYDFRRGCIDARAKLEKAIKQFKRLKIQENRLLDLPEITIEHKTIKKEEDAAPYQEEDPEPPNPADFLEACLGDTSFPPNLGSQISITRHYAEEEDVPHPCKICGRVFNSKSSLTIHAKFHQDKARDDNKEPYSCYVCEKVFSSKGHLALHSRVHIGETGPPPLPALRPVPGQIKLYRCDLCNKSYSMAKHLWGHVSTSHKGDPLVTCGICLRTFSSISNLEEHKKVKHKNEVEELMATVVVKQEDQSNHNPCDDVPVDEIPMDLSMDSKHLELVEKKPLMVTSTPEIVPKRESSPIELTQPFIAEPVEPPIKQNDTLVFSCLLCGLKFEAPEELSHHLTNEHNYRDPIDFNAIRSQFSESNFSDNVMEAETVFCCEICYREFNDRASLWLHMLYSHREEASKACGICLKVCPNTESLSKHVEMCHPREKTEQRRYSCQVCARQHDSRKKLVTHARIHKIADREGNLVDPETIVVLNSGMVGDTQTTPVANNDGFLSSCDICFKVFENEAKLSKHKRSTHKDGVNTSTANNYHFYFACELCGLSHLSRAERWKHMVSDHNGDPSITCEKNNCGKVFPTSTIKKEHEAIHHKVQGEYPNTCEICGKMWKTRVEYWKHMMGVHSENLPFICGVCLKVFCDLQGLVTHVREKHWPLVGGDFCCDICGRPYSKISKMSRHRKVHFSVDAPPELQDLLNNPKIESQQRHFLQNQTTTLTCDLCVEQQDPKEEFENIETLGKHRFENHNVMPCDLCTKYYGRTSHLWKHVNKIHKGHPDITCPVCQRTSASRGHLATHMTKHHRSDNGGPGGGTKGASTGEENGVHTCPKCSKVFRKESLVRKHLKHCKGPRPTVINLPAPVNGVYTCERCSKTFIAQNLLNKHMRNSHVTFKCEICEIKANTKTDLFNHIFAEHGDHPDVKCAVTGCDKLLRCKADLDRHQRDHRSSTQLHICKFCAEIVTSKVKLKMHLKAQHSKDTKHLCALCLKALKDYDDLRDHIVEEHWAVVERPNTCQVCAKPCSSRSKLMDHIRNHGPEFHPCKICLKIFPTKEELEHHCNNHPATDGEEEDDTDIAADEVEEVDKLDANSIIDIIGAPQGEKVSVLDHKSIRDIIGAGDGNVKLNPSNNFKEETRPPPNKKMKLILCCEKCPLTFGSKLELNDHKYEVHKLLPVSKKNYLLSEIYKKDVEEASEAGSDQFMQQLGLMPDAEKKKGREVRRTFDDDYTPSPCVLCGKVWPAKRHLWQHLIRYHKNEAGRCCGVCLKLCSNYTSLSIHLAVHHRKNFDGDGTNMLCKVCGKYHNGRTKVLNHSLIHFGHEDRACDLVHHCLICKSVYPEFSGLIEHLQQQHNLAKESKTEAGSSELNSGEKEGKNASPFLKCEVCSLVFASEVGLTNHRRIHERSDNFKCGQCGEVCDSADDLKTHTADKHAGDDFICTECKSTFSSYEALTKHNKKCKLKRRNVQDSESEEAVSDDSEDENDTTALESDDKSVENEDSSVESSSSSSSPSEAEDEEDDEDEDDEANDEEDGDVDEDDLEESIEEEMEAEEEPESEPQREEPSEIRAIEAYVCDNMEDNMFEVVKIELTDDIDGAVKSS